MEMKYCPECGAKLDPEAKFCNSCGADLKGHTRKREDQPVVRLEEDEQQQPQPVVKVLPAETSYADFFERLVAFIIDIIIIGVFTWLVSLPFRWSIFSFFSFETYFFDFVIGFLYFWLLESFNRGQTIGKMALRLRTVDEKTFQVSTPDKYALNNLAKPTPFLLLDFIVGILVNSGEKEQRIRILQNLSETVVIKEH